MSEVSDCSPTPSRKISGVPIAALASIFLIAGFVAALIFSMKNQSLTAETQQLKKELGLCHVADEERVYFVAIDDKKVPSEITENEDRIWRFRYFLPAGHVVGCFSGNGRVAAESFYFDGSSAISAGQHHRPPGRFGPVPTDKRLSIGVTKKKKHMEIRCSLGDVRLWRLPDPNLSIEDLVIDPVVQPGDPARSFGTNEIIPLFRIYDPASAKEEFVDGEKLTTYSGALLAMFPDSETRGFSMLHSGKQKKLDKDSVGSNRE